MKSEKIVILDYGIFITWLEAGGLDLSKLKKKRASAFDEKLKKFRSNDFAPRAMRLGSGRRLVFRLAPGRDRRE